MIRDRGTARINVLRRIFGNDHQADPPCPVPIQATALGLQQMSLFDRLALATMGRCGKPAGHEGRHAWSACGCPDWDFDEQRCYCVDRGHPDCYACY